MMSLRMPKELAAAVEGWANRQQDKPARSEAFRRLVELGLSMSPAGRTNPKAAFKASALAAKEIDRIADQTAPAEERDKRKRRLLKGPKEFRGVRKDHPEKP
jgi:metal-responsive CopG/Arc/MetJ family transcriptional regulator